MENSPDFSNITPQELHRKMTDEQNFLLTDTLTQDHFEKVHIPGAKNACVFEVVFLNNVEGIVSDRTIRRLSFTVPAGGARMP